MISSVNQSDLDFAEAKNHWNLEKLYIDLATIKGKGLTPLEKKLLRGLLCGYSPAELAEKIYKNRKSNTIRVYLSNGLYKYIQELISQSSHNSIILKNWSRITNLLEDAGYKTNKNQFNNSDVLPVSRTTDLKVNPPQEGSNKANVSFYGRERELTQLKQWLVKDRHKLVILQGMIGIGKTALALKLVEQVKQEFEFVIWRSLSLSETLENVLAGLIQFFDGEKVAISTTIDKQEQLLNKLRYHRCLLVLDNFDLIRRQPDVKHYEQLIRRLAIEDHSSCCLLISREIPKQVTFFLRDKLVQFLSIKGLFFFESQQLLEEDLVILETEQQLLIKRYEGNPLALKLVATSIQNVFKGDVKEFLLRNTIIFGNLRELLDEQFELLSSVEKMVMYGLALDWKESGLPGILPQLYLEALESLQQRSLIERKSNYFSQSLLIKAYILEKLSQQVYQEMASKEVALMVAPLLLKSLLKD